MVVTMMFQVLDFQEHLVATMMALEDTYFSMAEKCSQNVLIIADRGVMDASAFISRLVNRHCSHEDES